MIIALSVRNKKRTWCKDRLNKRDVYGSHTTTTLQELQHGHEQDIRNHLRMSVIIFLFLTSKGGTIYNGKRHKHENSITAEARLKATLRYLAT